MTTPTRQPSGAPHRNLVPSGSFLQQLLEEISGSGRTTTVRERHSTPSTPRSIASSNGSPRTSSAWVGGASIVEEARKQLRAADEARLSGILLVAHDGPPDVPRPHSVVHTASSSTSASSASGSSASQSPRDPHGLEVADSAAIAAGTSCTSHGAPQLSSAIDDLYLPGPSASDTYFTLSNGINRTASPLIFCDIDSDISATPSPTEAPTSALSAALTDATSISEGLPRTASASGGRSPEKRPCSPDLSSQLLTKKMRTMTLPAFHTSHTLQPVGRASWRNSIGGDNRSLLRESTFTERVPALLGEVGSLQHYVSPELSSFRPEPADPQGLSTRAITSTQPSSRRSSLLERDSSPEYDGTPAYAQSLHLVDTDVSIYKKVHGDEWRENSLCLHCFRRHGNFRKLTLYGYEMCGRNEALESHYWESAGDDGYD